MDDSIRRRTSADDEAEAARVAADLKNNRDKQTDLQRQADACQREEIRTRNLLRSPS